MYNKQKKEGSKMELKGSKTEANLMAAFAGESEARNKYRNCWKRKRTCQNVV